MYVHACLRGLSPSTALSLLALPLLTTASALQTSTTVSTAVGETTIELSPAADLLDTNSTTASCDIAGDGAWGGEVLLTCDGSTLTSDPSGCVELHACQALAAAFVAACDTTDDAGDTCPDGCTAAFDALVADCASAEVAASCSDGASGDQAACEAADGTWTAARDGWTEPITTGGVGAPMAATLGRGFGMSGPVGWGTTMPASVEMVVRWTSLVNRLQSRCTFAGHSDTCGYRYFMAIETLDRPGEALEYNCTYTAERDQCTPECQAIIDGVTANCGADDTYVSSAGIVADYNGMMGVMHMGMACSDPECTPNALGESFCNTLDGLAASTPTLAPLVNTGCSLGLGLVNTVVPALGLDLPYRAEECLGTLASDPTVAAVAVQDVCACTMTNKCPADTTPRFGPTGDAADPTDDECALGYYVPPPPPPVEDPPAPAPNSGAALATASGAGLAALLLLV